MERNADLDGLRGIAILLVMYCHGFWKIDPALARHGWAGVDLFFVLSGYLITSILLRTRARENYFRHFYKRRTLRIFPAFYAVFLLDVLVSVVSGHHGDAGLWAANGLFLTSAVIPALMTHASAFAPSVFANLESLWSVSIEEMFYLAWAPLVRWVRPLGLLLICIGVLTVSPLVRLRMHTPDAYEYWSLYGRMDGLACGALVALVGLKGRLDTPMMRRISMGAAVLLGGTFVLVLRHRFDRTDPVFAVVGYSLVALICASILLWLLARPDGKTPVQRGLRWRPLQWFGRRSYMLYLMNQMILVAWERLLFPHFGGHLRQAVFTSGVLMFVSTCAVAEISWRFMEGPLLSRKPRVRESAPIAAAAV
jgi:peptidoglycan/LPS O-acetylase OafA/YrhL